MTLWGGRFSAGPSDAMAALSRSVQFDYRLAPYDIAINQENVRNLLAQKIINEKDGAEILSALAKLAENFHAGTFEILPSDEDIHSAVERNLIAMVGEQGGAIRAGRSRNDLVATAFKLYIKEEFELLFSEVKELALALLNQAEKMSEVLSPGFTHLQHAQPIYFSQELAKHAQALWRDCQAILDWRKTNSFSPFGSGALSGSALIPDPDQIAKGLGFSQAVANSIDGVSDRDFVASALFIMSMIGIHLSRIGEEYVLYSSQEFEWLKLSDEFSTGSSIMPQKKNPDVAELARGKTGRLIGNLTSLLVTLKGLPFAYNRDLQEDKEPTFDSFETLHLLLPAITGMVRESEFQPKKISAQVNKGFSLATEIADFLARKNVPFSNAHEIAGQVVKFAEGAGRELSELSAKELQNIDERLTSELLETLTPEGALASRASALSANKISINKQIASLKATLERAFI
jgi:argininosuccinate lyase